MRIALAAALLATLALQPALHAQPKAAEAGSRELQVGPGVTGDPDAPALEKHAQEAKPLAPKPKGFVRQAAPEDGTLYVLPAPEVIRIRCPQRFSYRGELAQSGELAAWSVDTGSTPEIITEFRFTEVADLRHGAWKGASEIECRYQEVRGENRARTLRRPIHGGTTYRCTLEERGYSPAVECRLSITPDFP